MQQVAVDLLITGADIVTFDAADTIVPDGAIAISGNAIHWIGAADEAKERFSPRETLNARGLLAMRGFVDAHFHTAQQFLHSRLPRSAARAT